jgi:molybdate transport system ATP-binding protein
VSRGETLGFRIGGRVGKLELELALDVSPGTVVVIGPNGAGKTSLLSFLLGVLRPATGRIAIGKRLLFDANTRVDEPLERRGLGYVPQDFALFPHLDVRRNVAFALESQSPELGRKARAQRVESVLADLGLLQLASRDTRTLSGGEKQRVALARVLATEPGALLLDEPLAALDLTSRREVRAFLAAYLAKLALPTLLVSHDPRDAEELGSSIVVLERGRITQRGSWSELRAMPASPFVREFTAPAGGD